MYGAILGDMIGAPYEFDRSGKTKDFPLFITASQFTDDSVMTLAVANALMKAQEFTETEIKYQVIRSMQWWGRRYPHAGYGGSFRGWLRSRNPEPYNSWGNGSAMRVSAVGWLYDTLEQTRQVARWTAEVTHNHPEGIKGAESVASAIFLARTGNSKEAIRDYIVAEFGYDLSRTCDEIRPGYRFDVSCMGTVPEAITAFLEGTDFEDVIRTAVSLGGDCDTLTCIAGGMAEAFYGVPDELKAECRKRLTKEMLDVLDRFKTQKRPALPYDEFLDGNEAIEAAIHAYRTENTPEHVAAVMEAICKRMRQDGHLLIPVIPEEDGQRFTYCTLNTADGTPWPVAFTSQREYEKGPKAQVLSQFIDVMVKTCGELDAPGLLLNPWGEPFLLTRALMDAFLQTEEEYAVPDDPITPELLADGSFLKRAAEIVSRNPTKLNWMKLLRILRHSWVWIPCNAIMSDADQAAMLERIQAAESSGGLDALVGTTFSNQDEVRMVPDILQRGEEYFFPVFTTAEEMGEYGDGFSKVEKHFLEAIVLARNNERNVKGIVLNAFSVPLIVPIELLGLVEELAEEA